MTTDDLITYLDRDLSIDDLRAMSSSDIVAALKMRAAKEDDAEVCLDSAGESRNGDEFEHVESAAELSTILDGFDDLMITYADRMIADDPVWTQMKAQRQALLEIMT